MHVEADILVQILVIGLFVLFVGAICHKVSKWWSSGKR